MVIRCTRNEKSAIMNRLINDCYEGKETFTGCSKIEFDIIPLDFSKFPTIKKETAEYINATFDKEGANKNGCCILYGFIDDIYAWCAETEKLNLNYVPYGYYYSGFGFNDTEMLIYTWCEGDTTLKMYSNREEYEKERETTETWFEENT